MTHGSGARKAWIPVDGAGEAPIAGDSKHLGVEHTGCRSIWGVLGSDEVLEGLSHVNLCHSGLGDHVLRRSRLSMVRSIRRKGISRRRVLQASASALAAGATSAIRAAENPKGDSIPKRERPSSPVAHIPKKYSIRVLGTHVTLQEELRKRAASDLGIEIHFFPGGSAEVLHQAATRPSSFDLYEQWSNSLNVLWQAGAIAPIEKSRIRSWQSINSLTKTGRLVAGAQLGQGDAPYRLLHVQSSGRLGRQETNQVSFLPYVHNVDSFGYNTALVEKGTPYESESWGWLIDEKFRGQVALVNAPTIGLFDAALAVQAKGLAQFEDLGRLGRQDLNRLFDVLIALKREGHFRGVWSSVPQSVDWMHKKDVVVESMFSPAVADLRGRGVPCEYAAPREGYRAWHGVMCLSSACLGATRDAAYEYMNWWLSGWPGAFIARQGYYISTPQLSRSYLSEDEWNYWYAGKPTSTALRNPQGKVSVQAGEVRRGGSYEQRFSRVAVWNTVLPEYEYSLQRWGEFLLA